MHTRWLGMAALLFALGPVSAPAAPVRDAKTALAQVPASAQLVVHLRGLDRSKDRLLALVENAVPALAPKAREAIDEGLKGLATVHDLKGLVKDGPIFLITPELPDPGTPGSKGEIVIVVRVTQYAAFRDGFLKEEERKTLKKDEAGFEVAKAGDKETYFIDRKDWAVATQDRALAVAYARSQPSLDSKLAGPLAEQLLGTDVGLYVDMVAVNKVYGARISEFSKGVQSGIEEAGRLAGGSNQASVEMVKRLLPALLQAVKDSRSLLVTADFRPAGLAVHVGLQVGPASATNVSLRESKRTAFADLGRLPAGLLYYNGFELGPPMSRGLGAFLHGVSSENASPAVQAALKQLAAAGPRVRFDASTVPAAGLQVWDCADPGKAVEGQLNLLRALRAGDTYQLMYLKQPPEVQTAAEKLGSITLHRARLVWDLERAVDEQGGPNLPGAAKQQRLAALKQAVGEEITLWFGSDGKMLLQAMAGDWKAARIYLESYREGTSRVGDQPAYREARSGMPAETTVLLLLDLPRYLRTIFEMVQGMMQGAGAPPNLPFQAPGLFKTAYVALGLTLAPERARLDLWLPATAAGEVGRMFEPLLKGGG